MKKLLLVLLSLLVPLMVLAQVAAPVSCTIRADTGITGCPAIGFASDYDTQYGAVKGAICCMFSALNYVINWIFMALVVLSAIVVIWGAVTLTTAAGAPEKVTAGRNLIIYAVIGFAVALLSRGIPGIVRTIMGIT